MKHGYLIRPRILSELFTNLSAGWFALVIISPALLVTTSLDTTLTGFVKSIAGGSICLWIANLFDKLEVN